MASAAGSLPHAAAIQRSFGASLLARHPTILNNTEVMLAHGGATILLWTLIVTIIGVVVGVITLVSAAGTQAYVTLTKPEAVPESHHTVHKDRFFVGTPFDIPVTFEFSHGQAFDWHDFGDTGHLEVKWSSPSGHFADGVYRRESGDIVPGIFRRWRWLPGLQRRKALWRRRLRRRYLRHLQRWRDLQRRPADVCGAVRP